MGSITIIMGENPKPTAVITSGNVNFNGSSVTATFSYRLNAMSTPNYWRDGVVLEYGPTSSLGLSILLVRRYVPNWAAETGQLSITKAATTSPQSFYFRLNSVAATAGTPGSTGILEVSFATKSLITSVGDFNIEGEHWLDFQSFGPYWNTLWVQGKKAGSGNYTTVGTFDGYTSGKHVKFEPWGITYLYKAAMPQTNVGVYTDILYHLETRLSQGGTYIGEDTRVVKGYITGTMFTNVGGQWKRCVPFTNVNGNWMPCMSYENVNQSWKLTHT
jgi:hypothetical protein